MQYLRSPEMHTARIGAATVTFLQDWRTYCDVSGAPTVTFYAAPRVNPAQKL